MKIQVRRPSRSTPRGAAFLRLAAAFAVLALAGCEAVSFNQRLLVKIHTGTDDPAMQIGGPGDGWYFRHIAQAPTGVDDWYVAYLVRNGVPVGQKNAFSFFQLWGWRWKIVHRLTPVVAEAAKAEFGSYPIVVEPSFVFYRRPQMMTNGPSLPPTPPPGSDIDTPARITVNAGPESVWGIKGTYTGPDGKQHPGYDPVWWKASDYTQLDEALAKVESKIGRKASVRIGFIDTGFWGGNPALPQGSRIDDEPEGDADGWAHGRPFPDQQHPIGQGTLVPPGLTNLYNSPTETHATGTLGLLAGGRVKFTGYDANHRLLVPLGHDSQTVVLGGTPDSQVVAVRVAPQPVSIETAALAYAIDYASRLRKCDVISMSHGGAPTLAWADAVNAAYDRGSAIFAAESDYIRLSPEPLGLGLSVPLPGPYYPAAFRRVVGVTGADWKNRNYAEKPLLLTFGRLGKPLHLQAWAFRGSYGPDGWNGMTIMFRLPSDPKEAGYGKFRAWPIAAYGPNTIWLSGTSEAGLNGAGTSSATPQVAAAAALWLDYHRDQIPAGDWDTWRKAEAVSQALLMSTSRSAEATPDRYLGAGIVKAYDALAPCYDYQTISNLPSMSRGPIPADTFDARQSFRWLLFGKRSLGKDSNIAQLDQGTTPMHGSPLERMYYNSLLLEKWHRGVLPYANYQEQQLMRAAKKKAAMESENVEKAHLTGF
jgi:hypothetical protein